MNPFELLLIEGVAAHRILLLVAIGTGILLAVHAVRRRRWPLLAIGLGIAISPWLVFDFRRASAEHALAGRAAEVERLDRHPLSADHPRILVVDGNLAPATQAALMVGGYFDEVRTYEQSGRGPHLLAPDRSESCRTAARGWLARADIATQQRYVLTVSPDRLAACVSIGSKPLPDPRYLRDAVMFRTDHAAKALGRRRIWAGGAVEIAMRRDGRERLIDYREQPVIERPASLDSPVSETIGSKGSLNGEAILIAALRAARAR